MEKIKRVLIIRCGALGDLVYATSVITAIKLEYGENTIIDFVCTPGSGTLFNKDNRVNHVYFLKHKKIPIIFSRQKREIIAASKQFSYDLLINFEYGKQFKSLINGIHANKKIGAIVEDINISSSITHMVDVTKEIFKSVVSKENFHKSFPLLVGSSSFDMKKKYQLNSKYIIISPSNSHQQKNRINYRAWENHSWKELIQTLQKEIQIVIIGNKGEESFFEKLMPYPEGVIDLVGKTSLVDLIGVIEGAESLIATDTGTAHIASAVNTEVFALIGPTPANVTGPYQSPYNKVHIIHSNKECSPCYKTEIMRNCKDNICMKHITVDDIINNIKLSINLLKEE